MIHKRSTTLERSVKIIYWRALTVFTALVNGRKSVKDDPRSGRKVTVSTDKTIAAIEEYVMKDRRITVRQVGENFDIGYGTAQDILTNVLGMRRVCARWVPRLLDCLFQNRRRLGYKYAQNFNRDCRMKVIHFLIK